MQHDRELLLGAAKRNKVLELWEVQRYGSDSYGDRDYVSIYGMAPAEWHAKGVRVLGRTAVECTRDRLADAIGRDVAAVAANAPKTAHTVVLDPFAGSANTLYWLLRHLPDGRGVGFESNALVFELTRQNMTALTLPIEILNTDYQAGLAGLSVASDDLPRRRSARLSTSCSADSGRIISSVLSRFTRPYFQSPWSIYTPVSTGRRSVSTG